MITVFTPTYNRLEFMQRLYRSLLAQTDKSFEWIVVDDASTDGTDAWMASIEDDAPFDIKYKKNPHGGKHRAINTGVKLARGDWFYIVDSDDQLPDNSIETVSRWIRELDHGSGEGADDGAGAHDAGSHDAGSGQKDRSTAGRIAGVAGLVTDLSGHVVGEHPDTEVGDYVECGNLQRYRSGLNGDKAEIYRTDIMKRYPFPEFEGEDFVTERVVWDRIAHDGYVLRWYNVPIYTCEYREEGLSKSGINSVKGHLKNYRGYVLFVRQSVRYMEAREAVTVFREYDRTARIRKRVLKKRAKDIGFSVPHYLYYLLIKMPAVYAVRVAGRVTGR